MLWQTVLSTHQYSSDYPTAVALDDEEGVLYVPRSTGGGLCPEAGAMKKGQSKCV